MHARGDDGPVHLRPAGVRLRVPRPQRSEAHVIRNAGGVVTDDEIRLLAISRRLLGTREVILIHYTNCGMLTFTDDGFKKTVQDETGIKPAWAAESFTDLEEDVRQSIARITSSPFVPHIDAVRGSSSTSRSAGSPRSLARNDPHPIGPPSRQVRAGPEQERRTLGFDDCGRRRRPVDSYRTLVRQLQVRYSEEVNSALLLAQISVLDAQINALCAARAEAIREYASAAAAEQTACAEFEPEKTERRIAARVGTACRVSPTTGRQLVRMARDLHCGLDRVRELFAAGKLSEYQVTTIVAATAPLDPAGRAAVDAALADQRVETLGVGRVHDLARSLAAAQSPQTFLRACRAARGGRRVGLRPAADGMADLIAHLPVEQAVTCYAALAKAYREASVSPEPLIRGRGQVMADTLVERLTGQAHATDVNVEIQVLVPVEALVDPGSPLPAELPGHGPLPVEFLTTGEGRTAWRRLITTDGIITGGDSRQRCFTGFLATLIRARDGGRCTEPYCDASIRHLDHIVRWADGGKTTFANGRGLCEFHNQLREPSRKTTRKRFAPRDTFPARRFHSPRCGRPAAHDSNPSSRVRQ